MYKVAQFLAGGNVVGISSMTQYATTVHKIIAEIRKHNHRAYIIWGGIHAIIHPEDAIKHADAVCTGGRRILRLRIFFELFRKGKDYTASPSFWFNRGNKINQKL